MRKVVLLFVSLFLLGACTQKTIETKQTENLSKFEKEIKQYEQVLVQSGCKAGESYYLGLSADYKYTHQYQKAIDILNQLANELNISVITVKKAIKTLLELKWLIQFSPRQTVFRLNPEFVYRGGIISKIQTEKEIETLNLESETIDEFVDKATKSLKEETS